MQRGIFRLMLLAMTLVSAGCAERINRKAILGAQDKINDVTLVGVTRFKKDEFLDHLYIGESPWLPFADPVYYIDAYRVVDVQRIVSLYKAYGYYDARVVDLHVEREDDDEVDITITVEEGKPVRVAEVAFEWKQSSGKSSPPLPSEETQQRIEAEVRTAKGDPFEIAAVKDGKSAIGAALHSNGYPLSETTVRSEVSPEARKAWITYTLIPGRRARIGAIRIEGLELVPRYLVEREIDDASGKPYSPKLLRQMERSLYEMEVFQSVAARTGDTVSPEGTVDVTIDVEESAPQSIKLGVELGVESNRWDELLVVHYLNQDLFGQLTRLDLSITAGYAEIPSPWQITDHGPVFRLSGKLRKKGWIEKGLVWTFEPLFQVGIEEGYQYYSPGSKVGVSRLFLRHLEISLSHHLRFYDFFNISQEIDVNRNLLGRDFRDPYMLGYGELQVRLYFTDRMLDPRNGVIFEVTYDLASRYLGSQFDFHKITPGVRGYWQMFPRVQIAAQAYTGMIFPYGSRGGSPINMKYFLGGADTVRGWGRNRLSPRTKNCPDTNHCTRVPIGGRTMIHGSLELRVRVWRELSTVVFADFGDVRAGEASYKFSEWNYASGGGLRYDSPIGKFRADVGVRLNDTVLSKGENRVAFHLGLGEAF